MNIYIQNGTHAGWRVVKSANQSFDCPNCGVCVKAHWSKCPDCGYKPPERS